MKKVRKTGLKSKGKKKLVSPKKTVWKSIPKRKIVRRKTALNGFKYIFLNSLENKMKLIKKRGNIITFKDGSQIIVEKLAYSEKKGGKAQIIGIYRDSKQYHSIDELIKAIDWKTIEENWQYEADIKGEYWVRHVIFDNK